MFAGRPIIGLIGGIGAGKSHVARLFEAAGCCRIASDEMVRAAYTHPDVKRAVVERFGLEVLDDGGRIDRKKVADIVFRDPSQRQWLEGLLHPVANDARMQLMEQAARDDRVVAYIWDSPLLIEAGLDELCDAVVYVDAPLKDRVRRVSERGWDAAELARRENAQMPLDKKRQRADHVLSNLDSSPATAQDVSRLLNQILGRSAGSRECCSGVCSSSPTGQCGCA